jgi:hypothetical protein
MNKKYLMAILLVSIVGAVAIFSQTNPVQTTSIQIASDQYQGIKYNSQVCVYKNDVLVHCGPNLITDAGKNHIKGVLGTWPGAVQGTNVSIIALSNTSTTIGISDTALPGIMANECGLGMQRGTYYTFGTGAWNISYQFTNTCNAAIIVNTTALYNQTSGTGALDFAENTFTTVTLSQNDNLNVTWGIWVT